MFIITTYASQARYLPDCRNASTAFSPNLLFFQCLGCKLSRSFPALLCRCLNSCHLQRFAEVSTMLSDV